MKSKRADDVHEHIEHDPKWRRSLRRRIKAWYATCARDLPWRKTSDPYRIWISETMLQQTTVSAVIPYYERFLAQFPTVEDLAQAEIDHVLKLWEGLGYYSRARNLHRAAQDIIHRGGLPETVEDWNALPGIGRYTANAIISFAYDAPRPVVEANTIRLYSRLMGYEGNPKSAAGNRRMWEFAAAIVPQTSPGHFNHALMDLGATICRPKDPLCEECPVRENCIAFRENTQSTIPRLPRRAIITELTEAYVVVVRKGQILMDQRQEGERWAGLWDFPRFPVEPNSRAQHAFREALAEPSLFSNECDDAATSLASIYRELEDHLLREWGVHAHIERAITQVKHGVTRFRITVWCFRASSISSPSNKSSDATQRGTWVSCSELETLALTKSGRLLANILSKFLSTE